MKEKTKSKTIIATLPLLFGRKAGMAARVAPSRYLQSVGMEGRWPEARCMAVLGSSVYVISGSTLWRQRLDGSSAVAVGPQGNYPDAKCMAALGGNLYIVAGTTLWKQNPNATGATPVGPEGNWPGATCMAALGDHLFIMSGPTLWKQHPGAAGASPVGAEGRWPAAVCMAALGDHLYIVAGETLWKQRWNATYATKVGPEGNWPSANCMATAGEYLFIVAGWSMWRQHPNEGAATSVGAEGIWPEVSCMATNGPDFLHAARNTIWTLGGRFMTPEEIRQHQNPFPHLNPSARTSAPETRQYNCISWTVGETNEWLWPGPTLAHFEKFYRSRGFVRDDANGNVAAWGTSETGMLHGSILADGSWWESKCGESLRLWHQKEELGGGGYGHIIARFRRVGEAVKIDGTKGIPLIVKPTKAQRAKLKSAVAECPVRIRKQFALRYAQWISAIGTSMGTRFASDPGAFRNLDEFHDLVALGPSILPLLVEKLLDPGQFPALQAYDVLAADPGMRLAPGEREAFEGEQEKAARVVARWFNHS